MNQLGQAFRVALGRARIKENRDMLEAKGVTGDAPITRGKINDVQLLSDPSPVDADARRADSWVASRLGRMDREGGFAELDVLVTPALAGAVLALNTKNRHMKPNPLSILMRALEEDRWLNTGHPVVVSSDGLLQDGQHRLNAIIKAGISAMLDFRFGVDPRAFAVTDIGTKRTGGDTLGIDGFSQTNTMAAAVKIIAAIKRGNSGVHYSYATDPTNDIVLRFARENPILSDAVRIGHSSAKSLKIYSSAAAAAAFIIAEQRGADVAEEFFKAARTKLNITSARHPLKTLERVIESGELRSPIQVVAALVFAFNRRQARKTAAADDLKLTSGAPFPNVSSK